MRDRSAVALPVLGVRLLWESDGLARPASDKRRHHLSATSPLRSVPMTATGNNGTAYQQTYCWVMRIENGKVKEGTAYLDTELISKLWR
jgi:ketosteroid isomerase-like protein